MDKREKKKLLCWYDELSDDDDNIESEHDPFSDGGDFSGETQDSSNEKNADNNLQENQSSIENGIDDDLI
ncbi:hypothetical protein JTB14_036997 [Gonioctena quinquepunctata]|nr:hypothetical protein JTB14_036997 [Gonioctena quinquepunctata]